MPTAHVGPENPLPPLFSVGRPAHGRRPRRRRRRDAPQHRLRPGHARCCPTWSRTATAATAGRPSTRSPCWRTTSCGPPSSSTSAAGCGRSCTSPPVASCCTGTRSSSRRTSPCGTPGSPAAWSGTSGPSGTPPRRASRCTRSACCSRTARRCCGCTSSSGCARSCSRSTPGCPRAPPVLLVHVRIVNPNDVETPMYWWSNVAVPQADDVRVLAPADEAWQFAHDSPLRRVPIPVLDGQDRTYTDPRVRGRRLLLRDRRRPAALDRRPGRTRLGTGADLHRPAPRPQAVPVGEEPGRRPLAGVARATRSRSTSRSRPAWLAPSWSTCPCRPGRRGRGSRRTACCRATRTPCTATHWALARAAVSRDLEELVPRAALDGALTAAAGWADASPVEVLNRGSGWGALERRLREREGGDSLSLPGTPFGDDTLGPEQEAWVELVRTGRMPSPPPEQPPCSYQTSGRWKPLLEAADGWLPTLHLGVVLAQAGDLDAATDAWVRSLAAEPTAWAWRNLAVLARADGDLPLAINQYEAAVALRGDLAPLRRELRRHVAGRGRRRAGPCGDRRRTGGATLPGPAPAGRDPRGAAGRRPRPGRPDPRGGRAATRRTRG